MLFCPSWRLRTSLSAARGGTYFGESEGTPRQQELRDMTKPYLVITGENAWSRQASMEVFDAVPHSNKEMHIIPETSHFDMYDLAPFVSEAFEFIVPFFKKNL